MTQHNLITIYFDGACEPRNPGGAMAWAWLALGPTGAIKRQAYLAIPAHPDNTNNIAEYRAVLDALRYVETRAVDLAKHHVSIGILGDSQLVIKQLDGEWAVRSPHLVLLYQQAQAYIAAIRAAGVPVTLSWVRREFNAQADALTRTALAELGVRA